MALDWGNRGGLFGNTLASTSGLSLASVEIRAIGLLLGGTTALCGLGHHTGEPAYAHIALTVTSEGILASKAGTAGTGEGLVATVGLEVTLEVVSADKVLLANIASELTVSEMGLHV